MPIGEFIKEQLGFGHHEHEEAEKKKHETSTPMTGPGAVAHGYDIKPLSAGANVHQTHSSEKKLHEEKKSCHHKSTADCNKTCAKKETTVTRTEYGSEIKGDVIPVTSQDGVAANEMQRLNNILADYKTQMLALESNNRTLTEELNRVRQPLLAFEKHDKVVTQTHVKEHESDVLKQTQVRGDLAHAIADAEDFHNKFERADRERQDQTHRANALQELIVKQEADKELMRIQKEEADRQKRELEMALAAVQETMKRLRADLEMQRQNREAAETEVQKLQSQFVQYEKSVNILRKEVHVATEVPAADRVQSDLKENVDQIRKDYEQNRQQLSLEFEQRANKFYNMWQVENKAGDVLRGEVAELRGKNDQLIAMQKEVAQYRQQVDALKRDNAVADQKCLLLQKQYESTTRQCNELKTIVDSERAQIGQKSKLYGEVAVYRDIVEGQLLDGDTTVHPITTTVTTEKREMTTRVVDDKKDAAFAQQQKHRKN